MEIKNINFKCSAEEFGAEFLKKNKLPENSYEFDVNERGRFSGTCFITLDKADALKLLDFNGYKFWGRNLKISVVVPEEVEEDAHDAPVIATSTTQNQEEHKSEKPSQPESKQRKDEPKQDPKQEQKPLHGFTRSNIKSTPVTDTKPEAKSQPTSTTTQSQQDTKVNPSSTTQKDVKSPTTPDTQKKEEAVNADTWGGSLPKSKKKTTGGK